MSSPDTAVEILPTRSTLHLLFAYDVGFEIIIPQIPILFGSHKTDPSGYNFLKTTIGRETQPVRIELNPVKVEWKGQTQEFQAYATFFDVGAISLELATTVDCRIEELPDLALQFENFKELMFKAKFMVEDLFKKAQPAIINPEILPSPSIFTVVNIQQLNRKTTYHQIMERFGPWLAKTLRLSNEPIGASEVTRTLTPFVTYSDYDVVFSSANVAIIFDETSSDVIDILELLNVQSLELRLIDSKLDRTLQNLYEDVESFRLRDRIPGLYEKEFRRLNTIHLDSTLIAERVEQSFKFAFDSYLIRVHELGVQRMFLNAYARGIERKLEAIRDIITDRRERASLIRSEFLEWIIIILIAIEVIPFLWSSLASWL